MSWHIISVFEPIVQLWRLLSSIQLFQNNRQDQNKTFEGVSVWFWRLYFSCCWVTAVEFLFLCSESEAAAALFLSSSFSFLWLNTARWEWAHSRLPWFIMSLNSGSLNVATPKRVVLWRVSIFFIKMCFDWCLCVSFLQGDGVLSWRS